MQPLTAREHELKHIAEKAAGYVYRKYNCFARGVDFDVILSAALQGAAQADKSFETDKAGEYTRDNYCWYCAVRRGYQATQIQKYKLWYSNQLASTATEFLNAATHDAQDEEVVDLADIANRLNISTLDAEILVKTICEGYTLSSVAKLQRIGINTAVKRRKQLFASLQGRGRVACARLLGIRES